MTRVEQSGEGDPQLDRGAFLKGYRKKAFFVTRYLDGANPVASEGVSMVSNAERMFKNREGILRQGSPVRTELEGYFRSSDPPDNFVFQRYSADLTTALLQGTSSLDMVDLVVAIREANGIMFASLGKGYSPAQLDRANSLREAYLRELVQSVAPKKLVGEDTYGVVEIYKDIFHPKEAISSISEREAMEVQGIVRDRILIPELIVQGGLWVAPNGRRGESLYSHPSSKQELQTLNTAAADTIERLHLLKAYGIAPFEVSGERVGLPWDIAVVPPLEFEEDEAHRYAEGAVADFMLLTPNPNRSDILLRYEKDDKKNTLQVSVGDSEESMRFRLHDNGQLSYGLQYHNIASDLSEQAFTEFLAGLAFQRLRGLFISLAFDALVPDDVVRGEDVRGSVASVLGERQSPTAQNITDLLLRRRKALQRARVSENNRTPEGWEGPRQEVGGYIRKLPEGTRARPTAEQEAREYYQSIGLAFDGLAEGYNFVGSYDRRALSNTTYRRARFRSNSSTAEYLRTLKISVNKN